MDPLDVREIKRALSLNPEIDREISGQQRQKFEEAKNNLIAQFEAHPVSQEIVGGPDASNISGTLGGRGNLFTFIGFPAGSNPIPTIVTLLIERLTLGSATKTDTAEGFGYSFRVTVPLEEILEATPLPFESGNSWVSGIENGISGFSNFLYQASKSSRSGKGIETKHIINGGSFQPTPYLPTMLRAFIEKLGGGAFSFAS